MDTLVSDMRAKGHTEGYFGLYYGTRFSFSVGPEQVFKKHGELKAGELDKTYGRDDRDWTLSGYDGSIQVCGGFRQNAIYRVIATVPFCDVCK